MPAWNLADERRQLTQLEFHAEAARQAGNEDLWSALEDLVRATRRRIAAIELLEVRFGTAIEELSKSTTA